MAPALNYIKIDMERHGKSFMLNVKKEKKKVLTRWFLMHQNNTKSLTHPETIHFHFIRIHEQDINFIYNIALLQNGQKRYIYLCIYQ